MEGGGDGNDGAFRRSRRTNIAEDWRCGEIATASPSRLSRMHSSDRVFNIFLRFLRRLCR